MAYTNTGYIRPSENVAAVVAPVVTVGTEDPGYLAANLVDLVPAKPAKLLTTSGAWRWPFAGAQRVDAIALIHTNLDAAISVRLQGNATDVWTTPTFDQALTVSAPFDDLYPKNVYLDITALSGYSASGFQYWRLIVVGTNSVPVSIGDVVLGSRVRQFSPNIDWGVKRTTDRKTVEHSTDYAVTNIYDLGVTVRNYRGDLDTTDAVVAGDLEVLWRAARGRVLPFILLPFGDSGATTEPIMVRFGQTMREDTFDLIDRNKIPLEFQEVGRGLRP